MLQQRFRLCIVAAGNFYEIGQIFHTFTQDIGRLLQFRVLVHFQGIQFCGMVAGTGVDVKQGTIGDIGNMCTDRRQATLQFRRSPFIAIGALGRAHAQLLGLVGQIEQQVQFF